MISRAVMRDHVFLFEYTPFVLRSALGSAVENDVCKSIDDR